MERFDDCLHFVYCLAGIRREIKGGEVVNERYLKLRHILAEAWSLSYTLEMEAKKEENEELAEKFAALNSKINRVEVMAMDMKEDINKAR